MEIVWAIITPKEVSNSSLIKRIVLASFYSKPSSKKKTLLLDHISEVYHFLSSKYTDGLYWCFAADKNDLKIDAILGLNQNLKQCVKNPTRFNPPAILDIFITDLSQYYQDPICEKPLDVDSDKVGSPSDHFMVIMEPINAVNNRKDRKKKTFQYRSYTDAAFEAMGEKLDNVDWSDAINDDSGHDKLETFHHKLYSIFDQCFPKKTKTVCSENQSFFNDKLAKLKRRKGREYNKHRKSAKYDSLSRIYIKELNNAKKIYYRKKICSLRTSDTRQWFKNVKKLVNPDEGINFLEVEDIKSYTDEQQAELIADKFAQVSNEYKPLDREKISFPHFSMSEIPSFTETEVLDVLENMDTSKSTRDTDIPAKILKKFANKICKPLTSLINDAVQQGYWPDFLKLEFVTPVPKATHLKSIDDLRNISGLMNINKVMEKLICNLVFSDMKQSMDQSQFANQKGLSVQHYLIKMLDRVLSIIDEAKGESVAIIATMVDWAKAFPRLDSTLGIQSFIDNGVRPSLLPIVASFFENRRMRVKWHGCLSSERLLSAGGPQGSSFGIIGYLSQSNNNADCVPSEDRYKYMDDLTMLEAVYLTSIGIATYNLRKHIPNDIPNHNQIIKSENLKTQKYLDNVQAWTESKKMMLNEKKTKYMIFNYSKKNQFTSNIKLKGEKLDEVEETKLLGLIITNDLRWNKNTQMLVKNANSKMKMLQIASKFIANKHDLMQIYKTFVRSRLEYSCVVWNSSLTKNNESDIERVQKSAVRIIMKDNYKDYHSALKTLNLETLVDRRKKLCIKFAKKCLKIENMKKLFPLNKTEHCMEKRYFEKYFLKNINTERYKKSSIPSMIRMLNEEELILKKAMSNVNVPREPCLSFKPISVKI